MLDAPRRQIRTSTSPLFPDIMLTKRTKLRSMALADASGWKSFNNAIAKKMPSWPIVPSVIYARNEILHYIAMRESGERYVYTIEERSTGKIIGDFHIKHIRRSGKASLGQNASCAGVIRAEFGHALHPRVWGTGVTYETIRAVHNAARERNIQLWCKIEEENPRSWKSIEKYGAKFKCAKVVSIEGVRRRMRIYELL